MKRYEVKNINKILIAFKMITMHDDLLGEKTYSYGTYEHFVTS